MAPIAHAALVDNGNGLIYDTDLNITWYDAPDVARTWAGSVAWAANLSVTDVNGKSITDWRLPSTVDGPSAWGYDGTTTRGYRITTSEMGHLYYTELGNKAYYDVSGNYPQPGWGLVNNGFFTKLQKYDYWSGTESAADTDTAWCFSFNYGDQVPINKNINSHALAVHEGNVGARVFNLVISRSGTGIGTVTSSPPGINCGSDCSENYTLGTSVILDASPSSGFTFTGWSGDCSGTSPTCTVTMNASKNVTATFSDTTTPTGTISINSGAECTNSLAVNLTLTCTDAGSGCSQMQFSNDVNANWSDPETYATTKSWNLLPPDETKTVYAKFKDAAGNWSQTCSASIILDTTAPATTIGNKPVSAANSTAPNFTFSSESGATFQCQLDGGNWGTCASPKSYSGLSAGSHTFSIKATDTAGNTETPSTYTWTIDTGAPTGNDIYLFPRTGQTKCYDVNGDEVTCAATGQDGATKTGAVWPAVRFTNPDNTTPISGDEALDTLTGLTWMRDAGAPTLSGTQTCTGGAKTWPEALAYVACLNAINHLGHTGWRLPNINELESLINAGEANTSVWLNGQGFTNVQSFSYWSSTTLANNPDSAWRLGLDDGNVLLNTKTNRIYVWPVRGETTGAVPVYRTGQTASNAAGDDGELQKGVAWPSPRFTDNGNGTVTDNLTGLIWLKDANCFGSTAWTQAITNAKGLANGACGLTDGSQAGDWRLPNKKELPTIIDYARYAPSLPPGNPFSNVQSNSYWTSTTHTNATGNAWGVGFISGNISDGSKSGSSYTWPVRGGKIGTGIAINTGTGFTTAAAVTLRLSASDTDTVSHMMISNDGVFDSEPDELYATTKPWTLLSGEGGKTVYVKFKDRAGNWSEVYSSTVNFDATAPTAAIIGTPSNPTNSKTATLTIGGTGVIVYKYKLDNGEYSNETALATSISLANLPDGNHTVSVTGKDAAGNWQPEGSATTVSWVVDTSAPVIAPVIKGGTFLASQSITFTVNETTTIYYTTDGSTPTPGSVNTLIYNSSIPINATTTINFIAVDSVGNTSAVYTESYIIQDFTITANDMKIVKGDTRQTNMTFTAISGFSSQVAITHQFIGSAPLNTTIAITPDAITLLPNDASANLQCTTTTSTTPGTYTLRITATGGGLTRTKDIQIQIFATMTIVTDTLPKGIKGQSYTSTIEVSGGFVPITFTKSSGTLPDGLTLNADGTVTGTPTTRGTFTFTVKAQDGQGYTSSKEYSVRIYDLSYRKLILESTSWSFEKDSLSQWITVKIIDDYGNPSNTISNTMVNITSSSVTGRFTTDGANFSYDNTFSPSIPIDFSSSMFKYKNTTTGAFVITVAGINGTPSERYESSSYTVNISNLFALSTGWNFVSFSVDPSDHSVSKVLNDISQNVKVVWGYNNQAKTWLKYKPSAISNGLSAIEPNKGYWIYMNNPATLTVTGKNILPTVTLSAGWNLVGYGGQDNTMNLPANYVIIWNWENGTWKAKAADTSLKLHVDLLDALYRGKAYWIKVNENISWAQ